MNRSTFYLTVSFAFALLVKNDSQAQGLSIPACGKATISVPVDDHNFNKFTISLLRRCTRSNEAFMQGFPDQFFITVRNNYKEAISGRFVFYYTTNDGRSLFNSINFYCLAPNDSSTTSSLTAIREITNVDFIEFASCTTGSKLVQYTQKDTSLFRVQNALLANKANYAAEQKRIATSSAIAGDQDNGLSAVSLGFSDKKIFYTGTHEPLVKQLLTKVKGWRTNSALTVQDGVPPEVAMNSSCQRDQYVFSAVLYSWAAESYFRLGQKAKADAASAQAAELVTLAQGLCGDPTLYVGANCSTEFILSCDKRDGGSTTSSPTSTTISKNITTAVSDDQKGHGAEKEKELFYSLIPVAAMAFKNDYGVTDATAVSSLINNLDAYVMASDDISPVLKPFMKLAQMSTQMNLADAGIGSAGVANNSLLSDLSGNLSAPTSAGRGLTLGGKRVSEMSHAEISQSLEPFKDDFNKLLFGETDEYGHDRPTRKYIGRLESNIIENNRQLKIKYGYDVNDLRLAIRNFDNTFFDKIVTAGFPLDSKIRFSKTDDGLEYDYMFWGIPPIEKDLEKAIHYAARHGNAYALRKLIEKGSNVNEIVGQKGYETTPLFLALKGNHYEATKVLLEAGANPSISLKDKYFDYSEHNPNPYQTALKNKKFAELLRKHNK